MVVAHEVVNGPSPDAVVRLLREAEQSVRERLSAETLTDDPHIKPWREAYRAFGAKPSEFRSSVEAMTRRVLRGDSLPSINTLVDIGNVVSLRYLLSAGSHAIDVLAGDVELRFATGNETFVPFGGGEAEQPPAGEVIFTEGAVVLTRRWTWRQAAHTVTLPETTAVEFNVDGLPPVTHDEVRSACDDLAQLVRRFCGGSVRIAMLTESSPRISLAR